MKRPIDDEVGSTYPSFESVPPKIIVGESCQRLRDYGHLLVLANPARRPCKLAFRRMRLTKTRRSSVPEAVFPDEIGIIRKSSVQVYLLQTFSGCIKEFERTREDVSAKGENRGRRVHTREDISARDGCECEL